MTRYFSSDAVARRLRLGSLRVRVLASFLVTALVALTLALGAFALVLDQILSSSAAGTAQTRAQQVAGELSATTSPDAALRGGARHTDIVEIIDSSGRVVATTQPSLTRPLAAADAKTGDTHEAKLTIDGERDTHQISVVRATDKAGAQYVVAAAVPLERDSWIVKATSALLGLIALGLLAVTTWGINRVITRSLRPVDRIRSDVDRIQSSRDAGRVTVPETGDEIERLAATMNRMLERLDRADAAQRAFVSDASHELRSPLTTIRLLAETDPTPDETTRAIHAEAIRMQALVESLLVLAKSDDRGLTIERQDVDLDDVVASEVSRLRRTGDLEVTAQLDAVRVVGDEARLTQVVRNLADNATRHARSAVRFTVRVDGDAATVVVDNDGAPVPPQQRDAVFDRFVRLDEARDRDAGGSGLGLAICKAVAEAHGGTISTGVAPDGWCRFEVRLPRPE